MVKKHTTPTPHDSVFKAFLTDPDTARDFLTIHLPPALLAVCDLDTLQLSSGSFIEEHLRPFFSDVLYALKTQHGDGYVYTLIEHQSSPDKNMAFRMMRYAIAAIQQHLEADIHSCRWLSLSCFIKGKHHPEGARLDETEVREMVHQYPSSDRRTG